MATQAQLALAAGGTASAVAGGYGINYLVSDNDKAKETPHQQGRTITTFKPSEIVGDYQSGLIALFQDSSVQKFVKSTGNDEWWKETFEKRFKPKSSTNIDQVFQTVRVGKSKDQAFGQLSKACDNAYKLSPVNNYSFEANKHLLKNIFDFCTTGTQDSEFISFIEPKSTLYPSLPADASYANGVLSVQTNREHLVNVSGEQNNNYWWVWAFQHLAKDKVANTTFSGVNAPFGTGSNHLSKACDEAYKKNKVALTGNTSLEDIKKFCTKGLTAQNITFPADVPTVEKPADKVAVFAEDNLGTDYGNDTILGILKKANRVHFVKHLKDDTNTNTEKWWTWSWAERFNKKGDTAVHGMFIDVKSAYSVNKVDGDSAKQVALNQACNEAYKLSKTKYEEDHLLKNIAKFCAKDVAETIDLTEPEATTHKTTTTFDSSNTEYKNGLLAKNKSTGTANRDKLVKKDGNNNEYWWKWAYAKRVDDSKKQGFSDHFKTVNAAYNTDTALNQLCDASYKKVKHHLQSEESKLLKDIKKLCSIDPDNQVELDLPDEEAQPETTNLVLNGDASYTFAFATDNANKDKLIKPEAEATWWTWSFNNRFPVSKAEKDKLPELFSSVNKAHETTQATDEVTGNQQSLNKACKVAYKKRKSELEATKGEKKLVDWVKEFCAIKSSPDLNTPEVGDPLTLDAGSLSPTESYDTGVGSKHKGNLVAAETPKNEEWWIKRHSEHFPKKEEEIQKLSDPFKNVKQAWNKSKVDKTANDFSLNNACRLAYAMANGDFTTHTNLLENIKDYCAKTKGDTNIQRPG